MRVMRPALFLHLICLGTWLGCLLVEGVIEARARRDRELLRAVSRLHRSIDLWVEIPAFSGVLASGLWLSLGAAWTSALVAKVLLGAFAILVNVACLWPVFRRARAAEADDFLLMQRHSLRVYLAFAMGFPAGLAALLLALARMGWL